MDANFAWCFFLFIAVIIAIVLIVIKREKAFKKVSSQFEEEKRETSSIEKAANEVAMYIYDETANRLHCPFCDGENPVNLQYCEICGNKLSGKEG